MQFAINSYEMAPRAGWEMHAHTAEALLSLAVVGSCTKIMAQKTWLVLPNLAVWIPAGVEHATEVGAQGCHLKSVRFPIPVPEDLPREPCVISVSPLLGELIAAYDDDEAGTHRNASMRYLLHDEIRRAQKLDLGLPRLSDLRLRRVTDTLQQDPADNRSLEAFAAMAAMSRRAFMRRFEAEAGIGFAHWRRQLRLIVARKLLAEGHSITLIATRLGYASPSAFIAMCKRELGLTPGQLKKSPTNLMAIE